MVDYPWRSFVDMTVLLTVDVGLHLSAIVPDSYRIRRGAVGDIRHGTVVNIRRRAGVFCRGSNLQKAYVACQLQHGSKAMRYLISVPVPRFWTVSESQR